VSLLIVCKNDGRQFGYNEKWPLGLETKMLGYPKECHNLCAYGRLLKSRDLPRNIYGDLLPNVIRSVTGFGQKSGNRHFAKRVSPTRIYR